MTEYADEKSVAYESLVKIAAAHAMRGRPPVSIPVEARLLVVFPIPKSTPKRKLPDMRELLVRPARKPDADNIEKIIFDSLNGIVYADDAQVAIWQGQKIYGDTPLVAVTIEWGHLK